MPDRRTPFTGADERTTLIEFLDYLRESLVLKLEGLSNDDARRPGVPSGTSLLWLLKHLTRVEIGWFQMVWAGEDVERAGADLEEGDDVPSVVAAYREAWKRSNEVVAAGEDLDGCCARTMGDRPPVTRRWVLVHMVEETARHAGHADILREQIDGAVGR